MATVRDEIDRFKVGLTTTQAPFIEEARDKGQLYIHQPYGLYSEENHEAWKKLFARMQPRWERYANPWFQRGIASLCLDPDHVPKLEDVNQFLNPLTGFRAKAVSGYVAAYLFFDCLRNREFPTTITIRRADKLDYLPEPDIFHDIAGHVPMHTAPPTACRWSSSAPHPPEPRPAPPRRPPIAPPRNQAPKGTRADSPMRRSCPGLCSPPPLATSQKAPGRPGPPIAKPAALLF